MEFLRDFSLRLQFFQIGIQFTQDVIDPRQVFTRVMQTVFGFPATLLVLGNAGSLFKENSQLFRTRLNDARDHALTNDRVSTRSEAGTKEDVLNVAAAHRLIVNVISRRAVTR